MIHKIVLCAVLALGLWACGSDTASPPETQCSGPDLIFYHRQEGYVLDTVVRLLEQGTSGIPDFIKTHTPSWRWHEYIVE